MDKKQPPVESVDPNDFPGSLPGTDEGETIVGSNPPGKRGKGKNHGEKKPKKDTIPQIGSLEDDERPLDEGEE